jgi:hypothetical protein
MNEFDRDNQWQTGLTEQFLARFYELHSPYRQVMEIAYDSRAARLMQRKASIDILVKGRDRKVITIEQKIVRWPGRLGGRPAFYGYRDFFPERESSIVRGRDGWMRYGVQYRNTDADWQWLQENAAARWLGDVDFERIRDERNSEPKIYVPKASVHTAGIGAADTIDMPELDDALPGIYSQGFTASQPYRIIFVGEKSSLGDARAAADGRHAVILYLSDFDPAGWQMPISVARKVQALRDKEFPTLDLEIHSICLLPHQARELGLPTAPPKPADRRGMGIVATSQAEAIPPEVLAQIVRAAILERLDGDGYQAILEEERSTRRQLARRLRGIEGKP